MRIALLNPAPESAHPLGVSGEPMGILALASVLRAEGHEVALRDLGLLLPDQRAAALETVLEGAALAGISLTGGAQVAAMTDIVAAIDRVCPDAFVLAGGALPTFAAEALLRQIPRVDCVLRGEAEEALPELIRHIEAGTDWRAVKGVTCLVEGQARSQPLPRMVPDLDSLPFPARDLLPDLDAVGLQPTLITSRGCWAKCTFCTSQVFPRLAEGSLWRGQSAKYVLAELDALWSDHGVSKFRILDDNFVGPGTRGQRRAREICEGIETRGARGYRFFAAMRAEVINDDIMARLLGAGMDRICVGMETWSPSQLRRLGKNSPIEVNHRALDVLMRHRPETINLGCILFDPDTTPEELIANIELIAQYGDLYQISQLTSRLDVLPGTPAERDLQARGRLKGAWDGYRYDFSDARVGWAFDLLTGALADIAKLEQYCRKIDAETPVPRDSAAELGGALHRFAIDFFREVIGVCDALLPDESAAWRDEADRLQTRAKAMRDQTIGRLALIEMAATSAATTVAR